MHSTGTALPVDYALIAVDAHNNWPDSAWKAAGDDDADDFCLYNDFRFRDASKGNPCLRGVEDIDFEFVYALHTFVATVDGQANAAKGDTMVLLDDTNSYWWLVRLVKDSSIGWSFVTTLGTDC